jgi:hypothetical protein
MLVRQGNYLRAPASGSHIELASLLFTDSYGDLVFFYLISSASWDFGVGVPAFAFGGLLWYSYLRALHSAQRSELLRCTR